MEQLLLHVLAELYRQTPAHRSNHALLDPPAILVKIELCDSPGDVGSNRGVALQIGAHRALAVPMALQLLPRSSCVTEPADEVVFQSTGWKNENECPASAQVETGNLQISRGYPFTA